MNLTGCEGELLRRLAEMPFLDRMELAAVSGWSKGAVYRGVRRLEEGGLAAPVPHATDLIPLTGRFHLTVAGLRLLAQWDGMSVDELLRTRPVSARWRRILLERLDAVAAVYRLASAVSNIAYPMRFRWYRAAPMDAAIELSGGRTLAVVRQGLAADRTGFAKRVWRLWEGPIPGAVLVLVPDEARLRHARRLLTGAPAPAMLALERDAVLAAGGERVWHLPSIAAAIDLGSALRRASRYFRHGGLPARGGGLRSVHPDAFGILRRGRTTWPFFLEWERRAVRPATMAERLAPYLRYYSSRRPLDDHGAQPAVLVVFDDEPGGDPLPAGGKGGDGQDPGPNPPVGDHRGLSTPWGLWDGPAHSRQLGARPRPPGETVQS